MNIHICVNDWLDGSNQIKSFIATKLIVTSTYTMGSTQLYLAKDKPEVIEKIPLDHPNGNYISNSTKYII